MYESGPQDECVGVGVGVGGRYACTAEEGDPIGLVSSPSIPCTIGNFDGVWIGEGDD